MDRQLVSLLKSTLKAGLAPVSCQHGFYSGATYRPECPVGQEYCPQRKTSSQIEIRSWIGYEGGVWEDEGDDSLPGEVKV